MRRLTALAGAAAVALVLAACGGTEPGASGGTEPGPAPAAQTPASSAEPSADQVAFRDKLLGQLEDGTYGACECTSAERARDRVESGKAKAPDPDELVSNLP
ncbi:MAG: hypothetical protein U0R69_01605 [Gaiellales bacterium]